jgi:gamma-glutamylcyclotransferase (GGCT)/AIG2-like uncharacterized protein YtfP
MDSAPAGLFAYGSLMCADIMSAAAGLNCAGEPARLAGYARHPVVGEAYPGVMPQPSASVSGVLYRDLDAAAFARLDAFEGDLYDRISLTVELADGASAPAWCYVVKAVYRDRLAPGDWNFETFLTEGKTRFQRQYLGFTILGRADAG